MYIDNVTIVADGVTYTEDFNSQTLNLLDVAAASSFEYGVQEASGASFGASNNVTGDVIKPEGGEGYAVLDYSKFKSSSGARSYVTKNAYTNITSVSIDVYVDSSAAPSSWNGLMPVSSNSGGAYDGASGTVDQNVSFKYWICDYYGWKDMWVTFNYTCSGATWTLTTIYTPTKGTVTRNKTVTFSAADANTNYLCIQVNPGQTGGVWIDNVVIVADGITNTENFNTGDSTMFTCNASGAASYAYEAPVSSETTKFDEMVDAGELMDHILTTTNRITSPIAVDVTDMPSTMAVLVGTLQYSITDYKDIVILLSKTESNAEYLRIYNSAIALYNGTTLVNKWDVAATSNALKISVVANGEVLLNLNDTGYKGIGTISGQANCFELVDITGNGSITFSKLYVVTYASKLFGTNGIDFTAYASPAPENWDGSAGNTNMITEAQYQLMKEAGFTKILALYEGRTGKVADDALTALELCEKLGLQYYVMDVNFYNLVSNNAETAQYADLIAAMIPANSEYIDSPAYAGNFGADEPNIEKMARLKTQIEVFNDIIGENALYGGETFINLYPMYATADQLGCDTYEEYLDYYFENLAPLLGYACFDFYPIRGTNWFDRNIGEAHLLNLKLVAERCKEGGYEMRTFIQSRSDISSGVYSLSEIDELRFQIYSNLAFGSQEMLYYTYTTTADTESKTYSLVNFYTGETSDLYTWAKTVNNEVQAFGEEFVKYNWQTTYFHNVGTSCTQATEAGLSDNTSLFTSTVDALVGEFERNEKKAYMLVNYTDPYNTTETGTVTLNFESSQTVEIWQGGVKTEQSGTSITVTLGAGNGAFVIVK